MNMPVTSRPLLKSNYSCLAVELLETPFSKISIILLFLKVFYLSMVDSAASSIDAYCFFSRIFSLQMLRLFKRLYSVPPRKILFFGSDNFSCKVLNSLVSKRDSIEVVLPFNSNQPLRKFAYDNGLKCYRAPPRNSGWSDWQVLIDSVSFLSRNLIWELSFLLGISCLVG